MLSFPTYFVSRALRTSYLLLCSTYLKLLYLLSCLIPSVLSCQRVLSPTSYRESNARILLRALVPYMPRFLCGFVSRVPRALRAFMPHVFRALCDVVHPVPRDSRALCPVCPHAL